MMLGRDSGKLGHSNRTATQPGLGNAAAAGAWAASTRAVPPENAATVGPPASSGGSTESDSCPRTTRSLECTPRSTRNASPNNSPSMGERDAARGRSVGTCQEVVAPTCPTPPRRARSKRATIREDHCGPAVMWAPSATRAAGEKIPRLLKGIAELATAPIDHRAGFLLAHVDGVTPVQGLVDVSGMPAREVHEIFDRLRRLGIVALR